MVRSTPTHSETEWNFSFQANFYLIKCVGDFWPEVLNKSLHEIKNIGGFWGKYKNGYCFVKPEVIKYCTYQLIGMYKVPISSLILV